MVLRGESCCFTSTGFVAEVRVFRESIHDPALSAADHRRAYDLIVHHAAMLDPRDSGFAGAGVALKEALCAWLDVVLTTSH
jgi:hypothetical protein